MNLKFLETFIWVAKLQSFSSAAAKLNATQAAISSRIKTLEDSLGVRLFDRDIRSVVRLTPQGRKALAKAEELVRLSKEFIAEVSDPDAIQGTLTIGTMDSVVHAWLPELITGIQKRFPKVLCNVVIDTSANLAAQMEEGRADVCFVSMPTSPSAGKSVWLGSFKSVWIASPALDLPLENVTLADIARYPIISFPAGSPPHDALVSLLRESSIEARIHTANSITTIIRLVADGVGVAPVPLGSLRDLISADGLRALPIEDGFPSMNYYAVYAERPDDTLPQVVTSMAQEIARSYISDR